MPFDNLITKPNNLLCVLKHDEKRNNVLKNDVEPQFSSPVTNFYMVLAPTLTWRKYELNNQFFCALF